MDKKTSFNLWYALGAIVIVLLLQYFWLSNRAVDQVPYSEFLSRLDAGEVEEVVVTESQVRGKLRQPLASGTAYFVANRVADELAEKLAKAGVKFGGDTEKTWVGTLLSWILPVVIFVGLWYFLMRRMTGGRGGLGSYLEVGRSKARVYM
jgi:cell division protease FtsH